MNFWFAGILCIQIHLLKNHIEHKILQSKSISYKYHNLYSFFKYILYYRVRVSNPGRVLQPAESALLADSALLSNAEARYTNE